MVWDATLERVMLFGGTLGAARHSDEVHTLEYLEVIDQPISHDVSVGDPLELSVGSYGTDLITFQWRKDGEPLVDDDRIGGSNTPMLTISPSKLADSGVYDVLVENDCAILTSEPATVNVIGVPGDMDCDGVVNAFDIEPFLSALFTPSLYVQQYPECDLMLADINQDGFVDSFDIQPFLGLLFP